MKSIMISIKPKWVAKILNGKKTIEIRKRFPSDYVGWVYIYCTKDNKGYLTEYRSKEDNKHLYYSYDLGKYNGLNGKVVARFYCDKVEYFEREYSSRYIDDFYGNNGEPLNKKFYKKTFLTEKELFDYIGSGSGYAIHITKLEIFDKPKEISEFKPYTCNQCDFQLCSYCNIRPLTKAPQSWQYIKEELS